MAVTRNAVWLRRPRKGYNLRDPFGYMNYVVLRTVEAQVAAFGLAPGARVLDFGCGIQPYRHIFGPDLDYLGADLSDNPLADVHVDDGRVDLPDASVDLVLSTQVLEHVSDPQAYLSECRRLMRPGGRLLLTTHGVMFYHPHPTDFWRWTTEGLTQVVTDARLGVSSVTPVIGAVPLGLWLIMMNLSASLPAGLRHAFVSLMNLLIKWSNRADWAVYRTDFIYAVVASRDGPR